ncbi:Peptidase [Flavobacterium sp. 9AF]|uniref:murein L,D-transpeptidase catalytic domain-containing protein n=1 Tax=Flavobacterium sp. 9AF TaxID=2653142 RepID=UPI0012F2F977|nr:murein L,D-transpeptidase catalytic domain family protein [Flavobacterium sp. 9AF]VXC18541.1 Peptidase [Flavobacterium sp. 9AF]
MKNILVLFVFILINCTNGNTSHKKLLSNESEEKIMDYASFHQQAKAYIEANNFNTDYYYLIDLSQHSGKNRFFIYDFNKQQIVDKNLVTHGSCDQFEDNPKKWEKVKFDVRNNSHCSMNGKYKIGNRDYSSWGIKVKYWMHGLEKSNATAVDRVVVLHSWNAVKNEEIYPKYSPLSWGCPAVSNSFMEKLDKQLQQSQKPVLLWII